MSVRYDDLNNAETLLKLSVALRDEQFRNGEEISQNLNGIIEALKTNLQNGTDQVKSETLKVLINLTADSDRNRCYLISDDPLIVSLWNSAIAIFASGNFELGRFTLILVSQFVHNTNNDRRNVEYLSKELCLFNPLIQFLGSHSVDYGWNVDNWRFVVELLAEIMMEYQDIIRENVAYKNIESLDILIKILREHIATSEDTEYLDHLIDCITVLTSFTDFPGIDSIDANKNICILISRVPTHIKDAIKLKRKLFAISGSISSMTSFDNFNDVQFSIEAVKSIHEFSDPYYLAACLINIGNYIISSEKRDAVEGAIGNTPEDFISEVFQIRYNDIVQLQCFHFLTNFLAPSTAHAVVGHHLPLLAVATMIVTNQQYYPEVVRVFAKFLKKLLTLSAGDEAWKKYDLEFWNGFNQLQLTPTDGTELQLLALQSYLKLGLTQIDPALAEVLVSNAFSTKTLAESKNRSIDFPFILVKLKTIGMLNHYILQLPKEQVPLFIKSPSNYVSDITTIFEMMETIASQLSSATTSSQQHAQQIFQNALAFTAGTTLNVLNTVPFQDLPGPPSPKWSLMDKCKAIVILQTPPSQ
ncbi:uncharacterized protein KQ657_004630 [Scheffersomyces spartinae]|uniref:Uncharacterized protein n=1 Tax=Scheffersomyces spartinae TaxID=45513 RepID=A0A9P8AJT2_9ASCO|nr:uncharacterized protein KQ657_004630 [Scheffersomyces spartinae]KAG7194417.1 hypothetical protein KQ657_004630 [Scheffersomyces spartinae]